jgi:hypothetical protein
MPPGGRHGGELGRNCYQPNGEDDRSVERRGQDAAMLDWTNLIGATCKNIDCGIRSNNGPWYDEFVNKPKAMAESDRAR